MKIAAEDTVMSRIKLDEQQKYTFRYRITLQPRDINFGGHLGNDSLVTLIGSARADMFRSLGFHEGNLGDERTAIIMSDLVVNYRNEAFMFDEITIETQVDEFRRTGFRIFHRVKKGDAIIALVETGITTFDYGSRKVVPVPAPFLKALAEHRA